MKILFISRAYPPVVGGIENQNYELSQWLGKIAIVKTIANTRGKKFLPIFLPYALLRALILAPFYDAVLLGDGVLGIVGWKIKLFFPKKPVLCVVHGLDLTFQSAFYQTVWVKFFLKKLDRLIAVGNETVRVALGKGIAPDRITFIPNGVDTTKHFHEISRDRLCEVLGIDISNKKVILTSGRLARRKGVAWFITHVMPKLDPSVLYVVAGNGPDKENIQQAVAAANMSDRVKLLGYVDDDVRDVLMNTCDLFIQPNIKVPGDMEGFGISVIEAASCKLPVLAARLEGLQDAIKDGKNGFLIEPENADAYAAKINELLKDDTLRKTFGEGARQFVIENYDWKIIAQLYLDEITKLV